MADGAETQPKSLSDSVEKLTEDISRFNIFASHSSSGDSEEGEGVSTSATRKKSGLDVISTEFQGILMDLHNSMMGDGDGDGEGSGFQTPDGSETCPPFDPDALVGTHSNSNSSLDADIAAFASSMKTEAEAMSDKTGIISDAPGVTPALTVTAPTPPTAKIPGLELEDGDSYAPEDVDVKLKKEGDAEMAEVEEDVKIKEETETGDEKRSPSPPGGRIKLHVSKLPTGFSEEHISNLFEPFGVVVQCELFPYKNFAYVHLDNEAGGLQAIKELNKIQINGTKLTVMKSRLIPNSSVASASTPLEETVGTFKIYIAFMFNGVTKEYVTKLCEEYGRVADIEIYRQNSAFVHMEDEDAGRKMIEELNGRILPECDSPIKVSESKHPEGPSTPTIRLQVKNLPEDVTAYQIRGLFQPYGLVLRCTLTKSKFYPLRKAVVHLEQLGDIRSAIKDLSEMELNGQKLVVEHLADKPIKAEKSFNSEAPSSSKPFSKPSRGRGRGGCGGGGSHYDYAPLLPPPMPPFLSDYEFEAPFFAGRGGGRGGMMRGRGGRGMPPHLFPDSGRIPRDREMALGCPRPLFRGGGPPRGGGPRGGLRGPLGGGFPSLFEPRFPKRPYQNYQSFQDEEQDFGFDQYYDDPAAAAARDHYNDLQNEYEQFQAGMMNPSPSSYSSPPNKRPRGRGRGTAVTGGRRGAPAFSAKIGRPIPQLQQPLPSLMPESFNPFAEDDADYEDLTAPVPYQAHAAGYPSLQLPLGEREYCPNTNGRGGGGGGGRGRGNNARGRGSGQFQLKKQIQQRQQQLQQVVQTFQTKQLMVAAGYSANNYLVPDQIPGTSLANDFDASNNLTTAYPANYYQNPAAGASSSLNAVPFDYSNIRKNNNQSQQRKVLKQQQEFPPGVDPKDYAGLKPGAKVYVNKLGKVMVRGNRGGRNNKKRPGLGSKQGEPGPSGSNATPIGGEFQAQYQIPGPSSSSFNFGGNTANKKGQYSKYKSKQQVKDDNQEYTDWLASKAWMHQAIPGVVRPVQK